MVTDGNQTQYGDHFVMYRNIKSLCCAPGTNTAVGQLYFNLKKKKERENKRKHMKPV